MNDVKNRIFDITSYLASASTFVLQGRIRRVLDVWDQNQVLPHSFINDLRVKLGR